jgi:uncharacterized Fe-S center protein
MSSEVYFAQRRATQGGGLLEKLEQLCDAAGFAGITGQGAIVAVLAAFGEVGNTTFLRPQYAQRVVRKLRQYGGRPFLTDTLPLAPSRRQNGVDLLTGAMQHGFDAMGFDAPLVAADGLLGRDDVALPAPGRHLGEARVAAAVAHAESLVSIAHFTGHEHTGFAGAILNVGFGGVSLAGKAAVAGQRAEGDESQRARAGNRLLQERLVESMGAVLRAKERKVAFVNVLVDLVPEWDQQDWSDASVVADIGVLASRDPVAIDQASVDLFQQAPGIGGTRLGDPASKDKLREIYPLVDWEGQLEYAQELGLGKRDYELMII